MDESKRVTAIPTDKSLSEVNFDYNVSRKSSNLIATPDPEKEVVSSNSPEPIVIDQGTTTIICDDAGIIGSDNHLSDTKSHCQEIHCSSDNNTNMNASSVSILSDNLKSSVVDSVSKIESVELPYVCICGGSFPKSTDLAAHKRWSCKQVEKKCQCDVCKGWFAHEHSLRRHMKHSHGGIFPCDSCDLRFHNKMKLTRHWMETHYDDSQDDSVNNVLRRLKCYVCSRDDFKGKYELDCHLLAHKYSKTHNPDRDGSKKCNYDNISVSLPQNNDCASLQSSNHQSDSSTISSSVSLPETHSSMHFSSFYPRHSMHHPHPMHFHFPHHHPPFPPSSPMHHFTTPVSQSAPPRHDHQVPPAELFVPPPPPPPLPHAPLPPPPPPFHLPVFSSSLNDPTASSFYSHNFGSRCMRKFLKHQNKLKWKHYFKTMMSHQHHAASPFHHWMSRRHGLPYNLSHSGEEADLDSKTACEFCGAQIPIRAIACHKKRKCPVLCVFKCGVCDKGFSMQRLLMKHKLKCNHLDNREEDSESRSTSTISGLPEKLDQVLNLHKGLETSVSSIFSASSLSSPSESHVDDTLRSKSESLPNSTPTPRKQLSSNIVENLRNQTSDHVLESHTGADVDSIPRKFQSKNFICLVCRNTLATKVSLEQHLYGHISQVESVQKVQEWAQRSAKYLLERGDMESSSDVTSFDAGSEISSNVADSSTTDFDTGSFISSHVSNPLPSEKEKWFKTRDMHKHGRRRQPQVFPCEVCDEKFAFRKDLRFHMKEKHSDHCLECPVCHKTFSWLNRHNFYERHMKSHFGEAVFNHKCSMCDKTFLEKHKLIAHMSTHKEELLHKCSTCGKGYGNKSSLLRHQRKHTGDKPHQCEICGEGFWEKRELVRHSASHTGASPFVCSQCKQGFTLKTSLMKHMKRKHSGGDC